jgi:hypothetical protein
MAGLGFLEDFARLAGRGFRAEDGPAPTTAARTNTQQQARAAEVQSRVAPQEGAPVRGESFTDFVTRVPPELVPPTPTPEFGMFGFPPPAPPPPPPTPRFNPAQDALDADTRELGENLEANRENPYGEFGIAAMVAEDAVARARAAQTGMDLSSVYRGVETDFRPVYGWRGGPVFSHLEETEIMRQGGAVGRHDVPGLEPRIREIAGGPPHLFIDIHGRESAEKNVTSSANGYGQFIEGTWFRVIGQYGDAYGLLNRDENGIRADQPGFRPSPALRQQMLDQRFDAAVGGAMVIELASESRNLLVPLFGREPSVAEVYMYHYSRNSKRILEDRAAGRPLTYFAINAGYNRNEISANPWNYYHPRRDARGQRIMRRREDGRLYEESDFSRPYTAQEHLDRLTRGLNWQPYTDWRPRADGSRPGERVPLRSRPRATVAGDAAPAEPPQSRPPWIREGARQ